MTYGSSHILILSHRKGSRKTQSGNSVVKYCSDRCRHNKPGPVDRKIGNTFVSLLEGEEADAVSSDYHVTESPSKPKRKTIKG
jgi:hypothetical protein